MECNRCQHENSPDAKYCLECGSKLYLLCSSCGTKLPRYAKFCYECGLKNSTPGKAEESNKSPGDYVPKYLADKILASRPALEGERKQVTVLFADIKGSTEMIDDQDPEDANNLLDPVIERMMEAVHRYEGTVTRITGDGIMALFGAPLALEDHAIRACISALVMQDAIHQHSAQFRKEHGHSIYIRVGLNSGEVVVRSIGNDLYMEYTAMGRTTHLAARMEQLAEPGCILLTSSTLLLAKNFIRVDDLGKIPVKGLSEPVDVYILRGGVPTRRRFEAAAASGLARFVGRDRELEHLRSVLHQAKKGDGQLVGVVGDPAIGKSRLFYEFIHSSHTDGWLVLETASVSFSRRSPFLPVIDLLKAYFKTENDGDVRKIREKINGKLLTLDEQLMTFLPVFLSLHDVPVPDSRWEALDPSDRRRQTFDACKHLFIKESQVQPLLLVFEDLHWIDSKTQSFLDELIAGLSSARILLMLNYRPEFEHQWANRTYYSQVHIEPLAPVCANELLDSLLGSEDSLGPLKQQLIDQTLGNPFFLEESVRSLVETRLLAGKAGAYQLTRELPDISVPPTVQAVLAARIDRLPANEKLILQTASVIGENFLLRLLAQLIELPEADLRHSISHLQNLEFLYETELFPDLQYTFKHGLTYQVAYNSLLKEHRRKLHKQITLILEQFYGDRCIEHVDQLALHAMHGEEWSRALLYLRQAGTKAEVRSAFREAVSSFEQAIECIEHLPGNKETMEQAIDVCFDLRTSLFPLGEHSRVPAYLHRAEKLSSTLGDPLRMAWVVVYMCHYYWVTGRSATACENGQRARGLAEPLDDFSLTVTVNYYHGLACLSAGRYTEADMYLRQNISSITSEQSTERYGVAGYPAPMSRSYLAWALAEQGRFKESTSLGEQALELVRTLNHPWSEVTTVWGLAMVYLIQARFESAIDLLEDALERLNHWHLLALTPGIMGGLGYARVKTGQIPDGLKMLEEALNDAETSGRLAFHSVLCVFHAEAILLAGNENAARLAVQKSLTHARERGERGVEAWALKLVADIEFQCCPSGSDKARQNYQSAFTLASELNMQPLIAHCQYGMGLDRQRMGQIKQSSKHLQAARKLYAEMQMQSCLELVNNLLAGLDFSGMDCH